MTIAINIALIFLILVLAVSAIVLTVFAVKWFIELTALTRNLNETTSVVKEELQPILVELKDTMQTVNSMAKDANVQVTAVKKVVSTILGFFAMFPGKFKFLSGSFVKGFVATMKLFRKK